MKNVPIKKNIVFANDYLFFQSISVINESFNWQTQIYTNMGKNILTLILPFGSWSKMNKNKFEVFVE